jgi:(S)-ureidoglycine---glyoxylate transaminase
MGDGPMPVADLSVPSRLLAGGGPSTPDARVLRAMGFPTIGQFDPAFTGIMDEVMALARATFLTANARCFAVSGLADAGLESLINTLVEDGDRVAIGGGPDFVAETADIVSRYGAQVMPIDDLSPGTKLVVVPLVDPTLGRFFRVQDLATAAHAVGAKLIVEATLGLGGCELRVDDWAIDACVGGVDYAVGAPAGMALVTYTSDIESMMLARKAPPTTSYLDLVQLQAYWSPERLNHHTAPTNLIYALREALRLVHEEGLLDRWLRHRQAGQALRQGLEVLGLDVSGDVPYGIVTLPEHLDAEVARYKLLDQFGIHVRLLADKTWRIGLLGADARTDAVNRVVTSLEHVLKDTA